MTKITLLERLKETYAIDESRVYVTGFSMGGMMTHSLASAYPELFAAAAKAAMEGAEATRPAVSASCPETPASPTAPAPTPPVSGCWPTGRRPPGTTKCRCSRTWACWTANGPSPGRRTP